jgi:rhamnogalacturonyl hydrolase YesR
VDPHRLQCVSAVQVDLPAGTREIETFEVKPVGPEPVVVSDAGSQIVLESHTETSKMRTMSTDDLSHFPASPSCPTDVSGASLQKQTVKRNLIAALFLALSWPASGREVPAGEAFHPDSIAAMMRKVNEHTLANPYQETDRDWIRATYYTGVTGAWRATGDPAYLEQARAWGGKHQWQVGGETSGYNKLFCAMTWAELSLIDKDPAKIRPTAEWIASDAPNSPALGKIWYGHGPAPYDSPLYADSLYATSVFALLHKATGDRLYLDLLHESFWTVTGKIYDADEDLYYRDPAYIGRHTTNGRKILWSRGNGWVFAGLALLLQHLPEDDAQHGRYADHFRKMAASLAARQHDDGLWRANLADPDDYLMPESSGTAFFTFGLAWGINAGILDRETFLPSVVRGWHGLAGCVHPDGTLGWVQPVDAKPRPSLPITTHEYATGLFLLAGSEVLKLTRAGTLTPESAARHLVPDESILPPAATVARPLQESEHPLAAQINGCLERQRKEQGFQATGLGRGDYLEVIAGQVKAVRRYQDADGRIIDPVAKREMYFATPCYAHAVAALATANHPAAGDLLESGMKALDISIASLAGNRTTGSHGDFYTWPVMFAYEIFGPLAAEERKETWRSGLAAIDITSAYRVWRQPYGAHEHGKFYKEYGKEWANNWNLVHTAGEFLRARHGFTDLAYTDFCLTMQLPHFTPYGMYDEAGSPPAYDMFSRHYAAGMLHRGYRSFAYSTYRDLMWKGAWTSLFLQSPFGELPTGHRSSHHIWNEAQQAVVFEIYANHYARAGKAAEAGAFKRAAHLALQSVKSWIRPDGTGYIVKNRYPIEARHGYETYSEHTCYNLLACSMLAQAWQFADEKVAEQPSPADLGGFVVIPPSFHKIIANAAGNYIEYDTLGDHRYNPTGLLRVHLRDGHPQLGPSDGCAPLSAEGTHSSPSARSGTTRTAPRAGWPAAATRPRSRSWINHPTAPPSVSPIRRWCRPSPWIAAA